MEQPMSGEVSRPTWSYAQVAARIGKSVSTVEKWVALGLIPFHRQGRLVRFYPREIEEWLENNDLPGDNRIKPVHPSKRGGAQYVYPSQTLGDEVHCWCGEPLDHDWAGKATGAPHPHEHEGTQQVVVVEHDNPAPEWRRIERHDVRGFHAALKAFLVRCVNEDRLPWRGISNAILLFPPDGSNAISVYCRNNDGQMRSLTTWYAAHVQPYADDDKPVDEEAVRRLAEEVNDPQEHPVPATEGWHPYLTTGGDSHQFFETDGTIIRCRECVGTPTAYETPITEVRGLGGHARMVHRDTENLRTPDALEKSVDSRRYNRLHEKVTAAVELLAETVGYTASNEGLERENERLKADLAREKRRADDAVARLQLMKEAMRGLDDA
jgi:excisionase family DNA binding protein